MHVILVCIKWDLSNNLCSSFCIFMRCIVSFTDSATIHLHKKTLLAPMGSCQWIRTTHTGSLIFHKYLKIHSSTIIGHSHVHHKQCSLNSIFFYKCMKIAKLKRYPWSICVQVLKTEIFQKNARFLLIWSIKPDVCKKWEK